MAYLYIAGYLDATNTALQAPYFEQRLPIGATSTQSNALPARPDNINMDIICRVVADQDCQIDRGTDPTAVAGSAEFLPNGSVEYFQLKAGWKIAVIEAQS